MDTDVLHAFGNQPDWNESFYFNFYDRKADVCAFMRIGLKPNRDEKAMFFYVLLPDGSKMGLMDQGPYGSPELEVKGLKFERLVPERKWRVSFAGPLNRVQEGRVRPVEVTFAADFECLNEVFDYRECVKGEKEAMSRKVASEHLEQFGRARGSLVVGDKEYVLDGLGERDHSWGVREWTAPRMWIWLTCEFSEKLALNITKLVMDQGEVDAGFLHLDGRNLPVGRASIDTKLDEDGDPVSMEIDLEALGGESRHIHGEVVRAAVLPFAEKQSLSMMHETLTRYEMDGELGYGIAEYLVREEP
ncbi:MAG TPA: hypothetical protein VMS77_07235 [Conexivisphaerales archaeon]|nr:hypothetical protein [Conexivisphaerales archaeon]